MAIIEQKRARGGAHLIRRTAKPRQRSTPASALCAAMASDAPSTTYKPCAAPRITGAKLPKRAWLIGSGVVALVLGGILAFPALYPNILPGVTIGSVEVGGLSYDEAVQRVEQVSDALIDESSLTLTIYDTDYPIAVRDALHGVDAAQSVHNAMQIGRHGNPVTRLTDILGTWLGVGRTELVTELNTAGLRSAVDAIAAQALTEPVAPYWTVEQNDMILYAGKPGVTFDVAALQTTLADKLAVMDFSSYQVPTQLTPPPAIDIDQIAAQTIGQPQSATVDTKDGTTIIPEKLGLQFDVAQARAIIGDGTLASYRIPVTVQHPKVTAADLAGKLFRDTLAQTSTSLNEGNVPRTTNVRLSTSAINGVILNPGDSFSYNGVVGERTPERGYQAAGAYSGNQVIQETGGGICQPSSTLYMAVLRADLEVTERQNHSFTVGYTPLGEDATVSWGGPDFRFKNNTDYPVKIVAEQTDGQMRVTLLGTKTADKTVEIYTDVVSTNNPQTVTQVDNSLAQGQSAVVQSGITGYSTRTYKRITVDGKTTDTLVNTSSYMKRDRVVKVAPTLAAPTPAPADTPASADTSAPANDPEAA